MFELLLGLGILVEVVVEVIKGFFPDSLSISDRTKYTKLSAFVVAAILGYAVGLDVFVLAGLEVILTGTALLWINAILTGLVFARFGGVAHGLIEWINGLRR